MFRIPKQDNLQNVIVEVDLELIINVVKRISCGMELEKESMEATPGLSKDSTSSLLLTYREV